MINFYIKVNSRFYNERLMHRRALKFHITQFTKYKLALNEEDQSTLTCYIIIIIIGKHIYTLHH